MDTPANKTHKFALDHKRAELFLMPPRAITSAREDGTKGGLIIIGLDTKDVIGEHELVRTDVKNPAKQYLVNSIRKHGVLSPIRARKIKGDYENAEVCLGRDRVKACRVLEDDGHPILVPTLLWPAGTPLADIIGAANAENYARKDESLVEKAQHLFIQLTAEGYGNGADEDALRSVHASTGMTVQRIKTLLEFRGDDALVKLVKLHEQSGGAAGIQGEIALTLASIADPEERKAELQKTVKAVEQGVKITVAVARENVARTKKKAKAKSKGKASGAGDVASSFSKSTIRRIVDDQQARAEPTLSGEVLLAYQVLIGRAQPSQLKGMRAAMKAVGIE